MKRYFEETEYDKAKRKVKEIKSFYYHLFCYCTVIPIIIYINLTFSPGFHWFWFSLTGWGTGLIIHGLTAFGQILFLGKDWEQKKIKELMEKERNSRSIKSGNMEAGYYDNSSNDVNN